MNPVENSRPGLASSLALWAIASIILVVILGWLALRLRPDAARPVQQSIKIYCAAGVAKPVENAIQLYNARYGAHVEIVRAAGSGELAGQLRTEFASGVDVGADIYITADDNLLDEFQVSGIVSERFQLATQRPVVATAIASKFQIESLSDLVNNESIQFGVASNRAAVGKLTRKIASRLGVLDQLEKNKRVETENVMNLGQALVTGSLDAAIIWDTTIQQINQQNGMPILKMACLADNDDMVQSDISLGIVSTSKHVSAALKFARFLSAENGGLQNFTEFGYKTIVGDQWDEAPEIHLYMGSMFTPVLEEEVRRFATREGVQIYSRWEGCGKLISSMAALEDSELFPDAFMACDAQFMSRVQEYFLEPFNVSQNSVVMVVSKRLESSVKSIDDAVEHGLRIGICDPEQSALGLITKQILTATEGNTSYEKIRESAAVVVDVGPTLISQMMSGGLDVAVVYQSNAMSDPAVLDQLLIVPFPGTGSQVAVAVQQWAVSKLSPYPRLMNRLLATMMEAENRERFEKSGFKIRTSN